MRNCIFGINGLEMERRGAWPQTFGAGPGGGAYERDLPMIIECPNCITRYEIASALPPVGRKVRCARCGHVWRAMPDVAGTRPEPEPRVPEAHAAPPEPETRQGEENPATKDVPAPSTIDANWDFSGAMEESAPEPVAPPPPTPKPAPSVHAIDDVDFDDVAPSQEWSAIDEEGFEPIRIDKRRRRLPSPLAMGWGALGLSVLGLIVATYLLRVDIVRAMPGMARLYAAAGLSVNLRGLDFQDLSYDWKVERGRRFLEVRGEVVNTTDALLQVPTLTFVMLDDQQVPLREWSADIRAEPLPAGERAAFAARLPATSEPVRTIKVRFADGG